MRHRWWWIALAIVATHVVLGLVILDINRGSHEVSRIFRLAKPKAQGEISVRFARFSLKAGFAYRYTVTITGKFEYQATYLPQEGVATIAE